MTRNRGGATSGADKDRVAAAFPEEPTAMPFDVAYQSAPFHALIFNRSRITGPLPVAC
jgi:hypothetical protein